MGSSKVTNYDEAMVEQQNSRRNEMVIGNEELDIVEDMEVVKKYIEECPVDKRRVLLDNIAYDIMERCVHVRNLYDLAMKNIARPSPKKCYTDLRKDLLWLTKAQKVFQSARMKWQSGLKTN